jgi:NADH-quinone oxidoreductase subunit N
MAYVAVELVSLNSYLLVGFVHDKRSAEAGLKYLLIGALSSGLMLFGMSLLYGLTAQLSFPGLRDALQASADAPPPAVLVAIALMLAGLAFKVSMVPFHLWTPDAYEGAPLPIAALLSVGPKAAGLALLLRVVAVLDPVWGVCTAWVWVLTILTMTLGNVVALVQTNIKRLLAYSTIGQVGYLLIGVTVAGPAAQDALVVYLIAYLFMNLGLFACAQAVVEETGNESLDAFAGLSRRSPGLALLTALFLLSLAGLPPLFGFIGKFLLFGAAVKAGEASLALAAILNSAIALYYYVNILRLMYIAPVGPREPVRLARPLRVAVAVCAAATVGVGLAPGWLLQAVSAVRAMNLL